MATLSQDEAAQLYSTLQHFFEVAVHAVLYYRRLYPERAFGKATAFDVPVHLNRHPAVCTWVRAAIEQVMVQIAGGDEAPATDRPNTDRVNAIAIVVHAPYHRTAGSGGRLPAGAVLERWVFDVRHLPQRWPGGIEALRRAQNHSKSDEHDDGLDSKITGDHESEERQRESRASYLQSPENPKVEANLDDDSIDDDASGCDEPRYIYYDEEEELANAESEAELEDEAEESNDEDTSGAGGNNVHLNKGTEECVTNDDTGSVNWTDLDDQLRGVLQRLAQAGQQVEDLPADCSFTIAIELADGSSSSPGKQTAARHLDTNWIPETDDRKHQMFGGKTAAAGASTTSIRSTDCAVLYLECWVEESAIKHAAAKGGTLVKLAVTAGSKNGDILPIPKAAVPPTKAAVLPNPPTTSFKTGKTPKTKKSKTVSFSS
ncbi:hypothetical protein SEPCBS57363_006044 [Sporothrix epigloea]|uniref:HORMA domain-containing protein n=1 Tax=Sporothrix epigloea TaxID=1892477 RepID=A0ABP0E2T6_9PEZI